MIRRARPHIRAAALTVVLTGLLSAAACTSSDTRPSPPSSPTSSSSNPATPTSSSSRSSSTAPTSSRSSVSRPDGDFTINFAGDVHFMDRTARRLANDPRTVFGAAQPGLDAADLTMVNLETAITTGGDKQVKEYNFRAPPVALDALRDGGVDVATMANNHGADYGASGLADTLRAIKDKHFPVIGIGRNADAAFYPYTTTLHGTRVAIYAADQVNDETTLRLFSAGPHKAGVANAFRDRLIESVRHARHEGYVVIVYLHWGVEYHTCPSDLQTQLADKLADAGATAVIGTHAHVLQGAGWKRNGTYVAYGLGNYLWWRNYNNNQDDNGVLTLTFRGPHVVADHFAPSHLASSGVPLPATGAEKAHILSEWNADRKCTGLSAHPPH